MANRKVGADYGWVGPVAVLAALFGAGYLVVKYVLPGLQSGNSANNSATTNANTSAAAASTAAAAAAGIQPTLNANEMANIANQVYSLGKSASGLSDLQAINDQLTQCNNIADLNGVISAFGTRNIPSGDVTSSTNMCFSLGIGCTSVGLAAFVHTIYAAYDPTGDELQTLNGYFSGQGINYTF
jgi:hypothetical protein